jgi:maltose alpha-D-glucosyltransferase / alpha-amylase
MKQQAETDAREPQWYKDAVIYQIHVKSFFDSNNDGVGDFPGLISRLDYIAESGVTAIWLLPFYPSPRRDDGYDIADYMGVHPEYGTLADVRRFIKEAHKRGLKVITELVINHTSDQHKWFQRARKAKPGSAARNYYVWSDDDKKYAGTRIIFLDTEKSNWTWDEEAKAYFWHRFYSHQPDLNFDNPQVLKSVLSVMRFWLDMGVDGMRLDAVPYLVEREGTNNENLAETHAVLKRIRAELKGRYADRMLLAEANQWPEDTQIYFGDGDECHMAFHFPLMPRMYMAIAQEDRFPITDIMRQTPPIPETCQWAIFLRNHDELTLEMVTDRERDYLWSTYASDPRARLNLGIRRRLAPLLENDRRRIELMKSLLLTMPGTPVVYYGDEIGMGDNLHLGDRDGVRTPMQWSSDRNGGFSRTDPAALVLPAIMGPLYGYEAINVEAQWRNPHSLLNWFRRMLVERRKHKAFGRGTIRFLHPQNRKVLAYLREFEDETILCVANVARTAQAVELELSEFAGRTPVELSGGTAFPLIGQLTYLLTLPPYGFYWFQLSAEAAPPAWSSATLGPITEQYTFVLRGALSNIGTNGSRRELLEEVLPPYIAQRRWFQRKDEEIEDVEVAALEGLGDEDFAYMELAIRTASGADRYLLPLSVAWEDSASYPFEAPLAMARIRRGSRVGLLTDAFASPLLVPWVLSELRRGGEKKLRDGALAFHPMPALEAIEFSQEPKLDWLAAEQTNSSVVIDRKAVIKLFRKINAGIHPEAEMSRFLTERNFEGTPPLLGEVMRSYADGQSATIALIQTFVDNQGDGWKWTLNRLARAVDEGATPFGEEESAFPNYAAFCTQAGRRVGEMHAILMSERADAAFAPETFVAVDARALSAHILATLEDVLSLETSNPDEKQLLRSLRARKKAIAGFVRERVQSAIGQTRTRVHGDLHLGQLLVTAADVVIIDFEGEPLRSLDERRAKALPLRDVASMLRSFDYAAAQVDRQSNQPAGKSAAKAEVILKDFLLMATKSFFEGYEEGRGAQLGKKEQDILHLLMLEKALYEILYEAANRPDWIGVPLRGLDALTAGLVKDAETVDA